MAVRLEQKQSLLYPDTILDEPVNGTMLWWVAHTKSRREKALADFLTLRKVGYYLPLTKKRQPNNRRERYSLIPLFNGYLFFKGNRENRYTAYTSNHIARVLEVKDQERLRTELNHIYQALAANALLSPCDFFSEGQRVRVTHGPLKDIEGVIDRKNGNCRLVLSVSSIGQSLSLNVEAEIVEPV